MTEDIEDRLERLWVGDSVEVRRIALTMDQVRQYDPPPNPAKLTDSRATRYIEEYGYDSWELDALEPAVLADLIRTHALAERDEDYYAAAMARQTTGRAQLQQLVDAARDSGEEW
jgi:hypothetical protein